MKNREELVSKIERRIIDEHKMPAKITERFEIIKQHGFSEYVIGQYLHLRKDLSDVDDFLLFCLTEAYYPERVEEYFLDNEIKTYEDLVIEKEEVGSELQIKAVMVTQDQWVGKLSVKELMLWRNAQIINYNENAQRTMKHITRRGQDFYQIYLNKHAVRSIMEIMKSGNYIPNTLTFNMTEDTEWDYDDNTNTLSINIEDNKLDILDGYHRYIALSKLYNDDPKFDYNMEIRIVQFSENKAQQFIWQEDQKTKMRKSQSDAMNQMKLANQIAQRINSSGECDFYCNIAPNGIINKGDFASMVDKVYCINVSKKNELEVSRETTKRLIAYLNLLSAADKGLMQEKWDKRLTYTVVFLSNKMKTTNKKKVREMIYKMYDEISSEENKKYMFRTQDITKSDISKMTRISKEVIDSVQ